MYNGDPISGKMLSLYWNGPRQLCFLNRNSNKNIMIIRTSTYSLSIKYIKKKKHVHESQQETEFHYIFSSIFVAPTLRGKIKPWYKDIVFGISVTPSYARNEIRAMGLNQRNKIPLLIHWHHSTLATSQRDVINKTIALINILRGKSMRKVARGTRRLVPKWLNTNIKDNVVHQVIWLSTHSWDTRSK